MNNPTDTPQASPSDDDNTNQPGKTDQPSKPTEVKDVPKADPADADVA